MFTKGFLPLTLFASFLFLASSHAETEAPKSETTPAAPPPVEHKKDGHADAKKHKHEMKAKKKEMRKKHKEDRKSMHGKHKQEREELKGKHKKEKDDMHKKHEEEMKAHS